MTRVSPAKLGRAAYFLAPPLLCLAVFWPVLNTWLLNDDFAWMGLRLAVRTPHDLWPILFGPAAQGTIRVFSERLFFLVFSTLFGFHALPYRIWVLGTWFADLTLASLIGARLTGSRAAGLLAALLWATAAAVTTPLAWASAYNEVLVAFCILAAFYARLRWIESGGRKWIVAEWAAYLVGFGALEIIVMYPLLAALHALCVARKKLWSTAPLFIPAVAFTVVHFVFVPQNPGDYYNLVVDRQLPVTFLRYFVWAIAPGQLGGFAELIPRRRGLIIAAAVVLSLAAFLWTRLRRREFAAIFCSGWFLLLLAPVLPLPNHLTEYYVDVPALGLCWLAGWALAEAWRTGWIMRGAAVVLCALYLAGSLKEVSAYTGWFLTRSEGLHVLVLGLQDEARAHPGFAFLLQGVDNELFQSGFQDDPFRLFGLDRVYLTPGTEGIQARADLGGLTRWTITPARALALLERGQARVLSVSPERLDDITGQYTTILRADPAASRHDFVDVGDASYAEFLGPTWFPPEQGFRWMPKTATLRLSGPNSAGQKLYVTGYAPAAVIASGPVTVRFLASGLELGSATLRRDEQFSVEFPMPSVLVGKITVEISVEVSKVLRPAGDSRELGMVFQTFAIR
jgi:hypothetical protein